MTQSLLDACTHTFTQTQFQGEPSSIFSILGLELDEEEGGDPEMCEQGAKGGASRRTSEAGNRRRASLLIGKAGRRSSSSSGVGNTFAARSKLEMMGSGRKLLGGVEEKEGEGQDGLTDEGEGSQGSQEGNAELEGSNHGSLDFGGAEPGNDPNSRRPRISMMGGMMQVCRARTCARSLALYCVTPIFVRA